MQLTQLQRTANQREAGQSSWVELCRYRHFADATQLDVELSCVAINGPLRSRRELFVKKDGSLIQEGDLLRNPKLAKTFRRIAADPTTYYNGSLAREIVDDITDYGMRSYPVCVCACLKA